MNPIPYGHQWLEEDDIAEVVAVLRSPSITQGPLIGRFEAAVAERCGARFGVAFSSGTAALHGACFAAGVSAGDEVITTPLTFVASANAAVYLGGVPVFADIQSDSLNIDPSEIERKVTPRTKAILPVHFAGLPCAMGEIREIARKNGLRVIEDACHALGAEWVSPEGRTERVGSCSHSDMTALSFHPVKHITTGEGGMVLTNREELRDKLRVFRHHGIVRDSSRLGAEPWRYEMRFLGHNFRITDFQCALGLKQLEKLDRFLVRRGEIAERYRTAFKETGFSTQRWAGRGIRHAWHLYAVQLPLEALTISRAEAFRLLRESGLGVNVHYVPVHFHPFYEERFGCRRGDHPVTERYYERAITLPLFPRMSDDDVERVIQTVRRMVSKHRRPAAAPVYR